MENLYPPSFLLFIIFFYFYFFTVNHLMNFPGKVKSCALLSPPWHSLSISPTPPLHLWQDHPPITSPLSCQQPCRPGEESGGGGIKACILRLPLPCNLLGIGPDRSQVKPPVHLHSHSQTPTICQQPGKTQPQMSVIRSHLDKKTFFFFWISFKKGDHAACNVQNPELLC